jgi:hypothetical protein
MSRAEELRMEQMRQQPRAAAPAPAARAPRAIETAATQAARRNALSSLLNVDGPAAVNEYLMRPTTAYRPNLNQGLLERLFREIPDRIPRGTEMFRAPSEGEVTSRLPKQVGAEYLPNRVRSTGGAADLQFLGELLEGQTKQAQTGGGQSRAPGLVKITAMEDLPGLRDINEYLRRFPDRGFTQSNFTTESVLGPKTRYVVQGYTPPTGANPATWQLGAYANMGLGAANILGLLPMILESGRLGTGRMPTDRTNQLFPGANLLTRQDLTQ